MNRSSQDVKSPEGFDIEDVETSSGNREKTVVKAGKIETWEFPERAEKAKQRLYITGVVVALWVICTLVGLFRWITAGDTLLLISTPAWLLIPLRYILKYYFGV